MHNENQPRTNDGRFGTVPQSESDVELTAGDQLPEWQVLELARPGGKMHTVRAADPEAARIMVLDEIGVKGRHREYFASLLKVAAANAQVDQPEDGKEPELKAWHLEFTLAGPGGRGFHTVQTAQATDSESAKLAVYDDMKLDFWQRVAAEQSMLIGQVFKRSINPVR